MATKAYILIKVKAGRTKDALQSLKRLAGVEQAHSCFGRPRHYSVHCCRG